MNRLRSDDRGQITTALVMVGTVIVVALAMYATKLGQATDQKSQVQIAADAAALAGAQQIARDTPQLALDALVPDVVGQSPTDQRHCLAGKASASDFALRDGAELETYCYDTGSDTVLVTVRSLDSLSGVSARATAKARVGVSLANCERESPPSAPTPAPTSTPSPDPSAPPSIPTPALDVESVVTCGDVSFPIVTDGASGRSRIDLTDGQIIDLFTPALKS